jgi:hypothetical protein
MKSNFIYLLVISRASSLAPWKNYANYFFFETLIEAKILAANGLSRDSTSSFLGFPRSSIILSI